MNKRWNGSIEVELFRIWRKEIEEAASLVEVAEANGRKTEAEKSWESDRKVIAQLREASQITQLLSEDIRWIQIAAPMLLNFQVIVNMRMICSHYE